MGAVVKHVELIGALEVLVLLVSVAGCTHVVGGGLLDHNCCWMTGFA